MKKLLIAFAGMGLCATASGDTGSASNGFSMGSWSSIDHHELILTSGNPAMGSLVIGQKDSLRMGLGGLAGSVEFGQVDNLNEELEYLNDILDDPNAATESASEVLDRFDGVLDLIGREGYSTFAANTKIPFLPLYFNSKFLQGTVGVDFQMSTIGGFRVLDDDLSYDDFQGTFNTSTSLYTKGAVEYGVSVNYSRLAYRSEYGNLYGGVKVKFLETELSKQVLPLMYVNADDISDLILDEFDNNLVSSTGVAADLGIVWDASKYRVGLTFNNLNEPEFDFGVIGVNCNAITSQDSQQNCEVAKYFAEEKGEINPAEVYVKQTTAVVDAAYKISDSWNVSAAADLVQYTDAIGGAHQWMHLGVSYRSSGFIPSLRVGYHSNSVGRETSSVTFGTTLFKYVNFDFEYGLDSVTVDDTSLPRRVGFGLSIQQNF